MSSDNKSKYIHLLALIKDAFRGAFNFTEPYPIAEEVFDLRAIYKIRHSRYALSKKIEIYGYDLQEIHLFHFLEEDRLSAEKVVERFIKIVDTVLSKSKEIVTPEEDHRSTLINICFAGGGISQEAIKAIEKVKRHRGFSFGFRGWVDIAATYIDMENNRIHASPRMKRKKEVFEKVLKKESAAIKA